MRNAYYLPEYHTFEHLAIVPWPWVSIGQQDWVTSIFTLEDWLNQRVGPHWSAWAYGNHPDLEYTQACIAFKESRYKTLFLLTWA